MRHIAALFLLITLTLPTVAAEAEGTSVRITTSNGEIVVALDADKAPKTVANFLTYVDEGFYDGTVFHRVIEDFMIQGGGFDRDMNKKATAEPVANEAANGLKNRRGTIAMARTSDPHSATAQFFINHRDNASLDHPSFDGWGYTVFGEVTSGMDVVDSIATTPTTRRGGMRDVPSEPVTIESISRLP